MTMLRSVLEEVRNNEEGGGPFQAGKEIITGVLIEEDQIVPEATFVEDLGADSGISWS